MKPPVVPPLGALYAGEVSLKREKLAERCHLHAERLYELLESAVVRGGGDNVTVVQGEQWITARIYMRATVPLWP